MISEKKLDELAQNNIMEFYDLDSREFLAFRTDEIRLYKLGYRQAEADAAELVKALQYVVDWCRTKFPGCTCVRDTAIMVLAKWRERGV